MSRRVIWVIAAGIALGGGVGYGQTPEEAVAGVVEDMLTASKAGDVEALSGLLHEECIAIVPQAGVVRGDELLRFATENRAPAEVDLGEVEVHIYGGMAYTISGIDPPPTATSARMIAILVQDDDGWRVLAVAIVVSIGPDAALAPEVLDEFASRRHLLLEMLAAFLESIREGDRSMFDAVLHPDAIRSTYPGTANRPVIARASDLRERMGDERIAPQVLAPRPDIELVAGGSAALLAFDTYVEMQEEQLHPRRAIALLVWDTEDWMWKLLVAADAPLEGAAAGSG
jgi:ketosteroid isomerase-like protein